MKIRVLKREEIPEAAAIVGKNYNKNWERTSALELEAMWSNAPIRPIYYVAIDEGKVVGFAGFTQSWMDYNIYQIFWVNVLPERQGEGIGKAIVGRIISAIKKKKKAWLIQLTATKKNSNYYATHFGFRRIQKLGLEGHFVMSLDLTKM